MANKTDSDDIQVLLDEVTEATNIWIKENLLNDEYGPMLPLLDHALTKVVPASDRAIMVRLGCEMMGVDWHKALPGMAAFEFQNINLLVTDDYFDERTTKRMGTETIANKWGNKAAVALGFILKSLSNEALLYSWQSEKGWDLKAAITTIEWASKWQYYSQFMEDELSKIPLNEMTIDMYMELIKKATAVGIAGAIELGSIIGGANEKQRILFREFGIDLGCLLQIRDDCIDYIYNEDLIHKGAFSDLFTKRRRLPLLAAYWKGNNIQKQKIDCLLLKKEIELADAYDVIEMILQPKSQEYIRSCSNEIAVKAKTQLLSLPSLNGTNIIFIQLIDLFYDL